MKNGFGFLLLCLLRCLYINGQAYDFSRLDNNNGLSNNQVNCIFKDHRGFMWFGTNYGLNRYDGYQFKVYKPVRNDTTCFPFNDISHIREDAAGRLWIKSSDTYVVYDLQTDRCLRNIRSVTSPMGLNSGPAIIETDSRRNLYFYCPDEGVYRYDFSVQELKYYPQNTDKNTFSMGTIVSLKISDHHIWALFESGLLERFHIPSGSVDFRNNYLESLHKSPVGKSVFIDSDGEPWVFPGYADAGVLHLDMLRLKWNRIDDRDYGMVRDIAQDAAGKIWIAHDHSGITVLDKPTGKILHIRHDPVDPGSLSQNSTISLFYDHTGIMWVGTYKKGICYYHPDQFKFGRSPLFYYQDKCLREKDCNSFCVDSEGTLWIGTNGEGLVRYHPETGLFNMYRNNGPDPGSISSNVIISILEDSGHNMWFGTYLGGLNRKKGDRFVRYLPESGHPLDLPNGSIYKMMEDRHRNIWLATLGGGIVRFNPAHNTFRTFNTANTPALLSDYILSLYPDNSNRIYLSTSYGLNVLDPDKEEIIRYFVDNEPAEGFSDKVVYNVCTDRDNNLWMATNNGVNIYHPAEGTFSYLDQTIGLPNEQSVSLLQDRQGAMWVGTRNGLARVIMEKEDGRYRFSVVSFDESDGLASAICNHNAMYLSPDGTIYVGTAKGYTAFDPQQIVFNTVPPKPCFTGLLIDGKTVNPGLEYNRQTVLQHSVPETAEIRLPYNRKNFTIQFSSLNFLHPGKSHYRHILKGYDDEWHETTGGTGSASYANLSPGSYELQVYASNNDLVWSEEMLSMKIIILPPFWMSWWACLVYVVLIVFMLWAVVQYYLNRQKKRFEIQQKMMEANRTHELDEMKLRFFTNISHEFRTPLTLIINPVENMLAEQRPEAEKSLLRIIYSNARALLELVNQILDFRKLDVGKTTVSLSGGDIVAFIRDICTSFSDLADKKSVSYLFVSVVAELHIVFDKEKIRKIISNLLSNAFKFTPVGGKIEVNISILALPGGGKKLVVCVSDTGYGIAEEYHEKIFERFFQLEQPAGNQSGTGVGLHLSREYARLLEGELSVVSRPGEGSVFKFEIPVNIIASEEIMLHDQLLQVRVPEQTEVCVDQADDGGKDHLSGLPLLLIADDNDDFREFMSRLFGDSFRIVTASDGAQALHNVLELLPDLVISDVMMPDKDGLELCREMKADIRTSHIPVILLTARTSEENQYSGIEAGADDYIAKPFNMNVLKLKVSRLVERQKKLQERFRKKVDIALPEMKVTSMDEKFVQKAVLIVENNLGNTGFLVEDLVQEMAMSRVYFYKKILSLTGKTPSEFIRFIRLKRAAGLLKKSQMYVNEIALQVGFNDVKYFRKYFKDEFGVSPNEYKKENED